jgi:peptide/nickel transport system permease protein
VTNSEVLYLLRKNPLTFVAGLGLLLLLFCAVLGPYLVPHDPLRTNAAAILQPPSARHLFGTDHLGRDIFSRVVVAARLDIAIAVSAVTLSAIVGVLVGAVCGFAGGFLDRFVGRIVDVMMAFPLFVTAMALVAALGNTVQNIVLATAIINVPFYFRLMRAEVKARRDAGYVEAARVTGNGSTRVLLAFLVPNAIPPIVIQISLNLGWAILNAAGLSFIGLGVKPPDPEWGIMVAEGASSMLSGQWWVVFFPGAALVFSVFCCNLFGDGLRDILDPRRRT